MKIANDARRARYLTAPSRHAFRKRTTTLAVAILALLAAGNARAASSLIGLWERDTGTARVEIAPCGDIIWVRDKNSPTKVGMRVFYDIVPESPTSWTGLAFNPEDRQTYSGAVTIVGGKMTTSGCIIGKLFCKSAYWSRLK